MSKAEIWKDIEGFENRYEISSFGNVRNKKTEKYIKPTCDPHGYYFVTLRKVGETKTNSNKIHRLVAKAFIPNPEHLPCVNHKDGDKSNNNVDNLEWCTYQYNIQHSFANGLQTPSGEVLKGYDYVRLFAMYNNNFRLKDILKELGLKLNPHTLYYALKRKTYLRWFSEEDFYEKVQTLSSQLPKKETYKNHKKIELKYGRQSQ